MKIKTEHYKILEKLFESWFKLEENQIKLKNHINMLRKDERVKSLERRLVWDCYWCIIFKDYKAFCIDKLNYLNDDHLTTALMKIIKPKELLIKY